MATTIKLKNGSGAPLASDLVQGEPAFDLTNKRLYTEDSGGTVIEVGTTPTSLTTTGTVTFGSLSDGAITITAFVDEDNMVSNSATLVPTQQSVKAYVDSQVTAQDLDFQGDSGGALSIDLDSETLTIAGGSGIDTTGATNTLTVAIDSTVTTLTGTQTLTNKTLTTPIISSISNTGTLTLPTSTDTLVGRATTDTLTNKTLTAPVISSISNTGTLTLPTSTDVLVGRATTDTLTNKTLTSPVINTGVSGTAVLDDDTFATASATTLATSESIKAYVDAQVDTADQLTELSDVNITTPADGALLFYDTLTTKWIDNVVSGDITIADTGVAAISSGVIVNADVNASAAISVSKTALTAGTGLTLTTDTLSVDASQTQITAVGTIATGTWQGTAIADAYVADNLTISGGTVDNTVIGGTTAAAGTFTTFTSTGIDDNAVSTAITIDASQDVTFTSDAKFPDSGKAIFGAGSDLQIYHDGAHSYVSDQGTGNLLIRGENVLLQKADGTENYLRAVPNAEVKIYYDGSEKLATTFTGIDVTGDVNSDSVTTGTFTSTGIDDNATSTAITIDSSENVGIGTASPANKLVIKDSGSPALEINGQGRVNSLTLGVTAAESRLFENANTALAFGTNATERMRIDSSGNVGIGTTAPESELHVRAITAPANITLERSGANAAGNELGSLQFKNADGSNDGPNVVCNVLAGVPNANGSGGYLTFGTHGGSDGGEGSGPNERMRIDSVGNVGIGTTSPDGKLNVFSASAGTVTADADADELVLENSGNVGLSLLTASTGESGVYFGNPGTNGQKDFYLKYYHESHATTANRRAFTFNTASTERMRIDSAGNVGIGTSSPANILNLNDNTEGGHDLAINRNTTYGTNTGMGGISWYDQAGSNILARINAGTNGNATSSRISFDVSSLGVKSEAMRIDSSGNLLLGRTSTPSGIQAGSLCINFDIHHQDAAGNDRLLYDRSSNLLGNTGTNVTCATLSKSSGSFKIDHPLPEKTKTHHLVHSFVEAPQADNIYRGTVDLVDGTATVNLDTAGRMSEGTFVLLNTNIQCFTTNESGWIAVKGFVSENVLTITAQESCEDTVSWMVVGERCDQHMIDTDWTNETGRIITEPLKGA